MAASNVVASVAVMIRPITKGFKQNIKDAYEGAVSEIKADAPEVDTDGIEEQGKRAGNRFSEAFGKWAKRALVTVGVAAGAAVGAAFVGGFRSAINQQQGQLVLSGLYGDAEKARKTLEGIRGIASTSPIDYAAYQSAAESLAYAGAEGEDAIGVLENVGKAITAAGGDSSNMDRATDAILKGVNAGKFQLDTLQQLSDAGIPILSGLAEHFGVSIEEVNSMASAGKIQLEDVMAVLSDGTGDVFQQMITAGEDASQSFSNQWKIAKDNVAVAIGRVMLPLIEALAPAIQPAADALVGMIEGLSANLPGIVKQFRDWAPVIGTLVGGFIAYEVTMRAMRIATIAWTAISKVARIATAGWAVQQRLLNTALRANPIGAVITVLTLLVAGFILAYKKSETFRRIVNAAWEGIKAAAAATWEWIRDTLWPGILAAWDAISNGAIWLYENAILPAWNGIRTAISATVDWLVNTAWPFIKSVWDAIAGAAIWLWQSVIQPVWNGIKLAIAIAVTAILVYIDLLKWYFDSVIAPVAMWLWRNVMQPVWNGVKTAIGAVVGWFRDTAWPILSSVIDWISTKFDQFKIGLGIIWGFVKNQIIAPVVNWLVNTVWPRLRGFIDLVIEGFRIWRDRIKAVWDFVKNQVIAPVVNWLQNTVWPRVKSFIDLVVEGFRIWRDRIKAVWDFVKDRVVAPVVAWFENTVQPKIDAVTGHIQSAFETMKEGVKKAWEAIQSAARKPVEFVIKDVYDQSLRSTFNDVAEKLSLPEKWRLPPAKLGFATGGIMPGYTPGRDVHRFISPTGGVLDLSGGEPILRPEVGRVLGTGWVHGINAAARTAGVSGVQAFLGNGAHQAFAGGGVWRAIKNIGGDTWDWLTDKASTVAEALKDPFGVLTKLAGKAVDLIPGGGMFRAVTVQAGKNAGEMLGDWLRSQLAPASAAIGEMPPGASRSLGYAQQVARSFGLTMTSFRRGGARTAGSGSVSLHALGRAMDFSNSSGPTSQMMGFFNAMHPLRPTELLYSPAGGRQWRRGGYMADTSGATKRMHYNHVHVGFAGGGVFDPRPTLFDDGGIIPPGLTTMLNASRKPEAALTNEQLEQLRTLTSRDPDTGDTFQVFAQNDKAAELVSELMWAQKTRRRRGRYAHAGR